MLRILSSPGVPATMRGYATIAARMPRRLPNREAREPKRIGLRRISAKSWRQSPHPRLLPYLRHSRCWGRPLPSDGTKRRARAPPLGATSCTLRVTRMRPCSCAVAVSNPLFSASCLDEERVLMVTKSISMPVKSAISIAELATANATCHPKKIQSATKPYQLNQRVAIRKAHAGPARLPPRHSVSAVGIAVQQHNGVKHPIVAPIKLARHREYPDR